MASYLDQIKSANPDAYDQLVKLAQYSANEAYGGKPQDWQAQIFTPLKADAPKTINPNAKPIIDGYTRDEDGNIVPRIQGYEPPEGVRAETEWGGDGEAVRYYVKDLGKINGLSVSAKYDAQGNLTGYLGDQAQRNWLNGNQSVSGAWDAEGKPIPVQYSSSSGGWAGNIVGDLAGSFGGYAPLLANLVLPGAGTALSLANVALNNGDLSTALKNVAISQAIGQSGIGGDVAEATGSQALGQLASGTASGLVQGKDLDAALTNAAINTASSQGVGALNQASTDQQLEDWSRQQAENRYNNSVSPTEQDVLVADPSIKMDFPLSTPVDQSGPGYFDEITGKFIPSEFGQYNGPLTDASGTNLDSMNGYDFDPTTNMWTTPDGQTYDMSYLENSGQAVSGSDILEPPSEDTTLPESFDPTIVPSSLVKALLNGSSGQMPGGKPGSSQPGSAATEATTYDPATGQKTAKISPLDETGLLNPLLFSLAGFQAPKQQAIKDPFSDLALGTSGFTPTESNAAPFADLSMGSSYFAPAQQETASFAQGGLASAHPAGEPEFYSEGGLNNRYIKGEGDGTSDSIPAMVADSEFVMPADVVAALGNGSSDAGASKLDQMVQQIRKRARSTAPDQLPPTAHESPLDYLKGRA